MHGRKASHVCMRRARARARAAAAARRRRRPARLHMVKMASAAGKLAAIVLLLALSSDGRNSAAVATTAARAPALRVAVTPARWWPALIKTTDGAGGVHPYYSRLQETTLPSSLDNSSRVLWNEFWLQQCNASSFPLSQFGIAANARNAQNGDVVTILGGGSLEGQHRQGPFMDWPKISKDGTMQNGGLPQRANLSAAMHRIDAAIAALPPGFHGSLYFDMESWDPLWGMTPPQYRNASLAWVLQRHPGLSRGAAIAQAQTEYEAAAKSWMMAPLQSVRRQRPRALVGYYNYPKCADRMQCEQYPAGSNASAMNDQLSWLCAVSSSSSSSSSSPPHCRLAAACCLVLAACVRVACDGRTVEADVLYSYI
jgi:hypothetical protein